MKILKYILAFLFGAFAGLFIYLDLAAILFRDPPVWFVLTSFFGGWGLTTYWVLRGTKTLSEMLARSFLVSAILSFGFAPATLFLATKSVDTGGSDAEVIGSLIGGGLVSGFGITISLLFTFLSLVGYGLVKLFNRENRVPDSNLVACDFCAEPVRKAAKKCRHCGEFLQSVKSETSEALEERGLER